MKKQAGRWKKNWKQFAGLWILHNSSYDGGCIENATLLVVPNAQVYKWLKKLFEVMALVIVKPTSTFPAFYVKFYSFRAGICTEQTTRRS